MKNFIPISRNFFSHSFWEAKKEFDYADAWLDILQLVSFKDGNSKLIKSSICKWDRGQYPVSHSFLADRWGWKVGRVRTFEKLLVTEGMVTLERTPSWTLLTVCKYDDYNGSEQANDSLITGEEQANNRQKTGEAQQLKKVKKENKEKKEKFDHFWSLYPKKVNRKDSIAIWDKLSDADISKIMDTIRNFIAYKPFEDYTHPNPKSYLNQRRWEDEIPTGEIPISHGNRKATDDSIDFVNNLRNGEDAA